MTGLLRTHGIAGHTPRWVSAAQGDPQAPPPPALNILQLSWWEPTCDKLPGSQNPSVSQGLVLSCYGRSVESQDS